MGSKRKRPEADAAASLTFPLQPCSIRGMLARTAWLGVEVHRGGCFAIQGGKQKEEEEERGGGFFCTPPRPATKKGKEPAASSLPITHHHPFSPIETGAIRSKRFPPPLLSPAVEGKWQEMSANDRADRPPSPLFLSIRIAICNLKGAAELVPTY